MVEGTTTHAVTSSDGQRTDGQRTDGEQADGQPADGTAAPAAPEKGTGLARASLLMAAGTMVSRATGLIRTTLQTSALGAGLLASSYGIANVVPMSIYTLLIGGALNSVLVPQLVRA